MERSAIFAHVGILHPGAMGVAVGLSLRNSGCEVQWASQGRGSRTRVRAEQAGLIDAGSLAELCQTCELIVSVCPPEFAETLSEDVTRYGFSGTYLDANAVAPARKQRMAARMERAGIRFVDGGIIGLPPSASGETYILLSGEQAPQAATCFRNGPLEPEVIGMEVGKASAVKMCFAAYSKGSTALAAAVLSTADHFGVLHEVTAQWKRRGSKFTQLERELQQAASKAWRFAPEMLEIAATFEAAGESPEFHRAAASIFERLSEFKDAEGIFLETMIRKLNEKRGRSGHAEVAKQSTI